MEKVLRYASIHKEQRLHINTKKVTRFFFFKDFNLESIKAAAFRTSKRVSHTSVRVKRADVQHRSGSGGLLKAYFS